MASLRPIVLASASPYRRELLLRFGLPFEWVAPKVDESEIPGESGPETALRLAILKARAVAAGFPNAIVIGSDQVATCNGVRVGKPGTHANAVKQLEFMSGKVATFDTALAVLDTATGEVRSRVVPCNVTFRPLTPAIIEAYLQREQPYDCAGSAKAEGLGIALIARIQTDDPTALIGLPLIALAELLAAAGIPVIG